MIKELLLVGFCGFMGSAARFGLNIWFTNRDLTSFPWATLVVNILGCFLVGALSAFITPAQRIFNLAGVVGFAGGFTTFSAFGLETFLLLQSGSTILAFANMAANLVLGITSVYLGRIIF